MLKILLVEDGTVDVMLTKIALEDSKIPHQLEVARDGEEAFRMLFDQPVDLLLLDIKMPKVNGFELLERIRSLGRGLLPTIMLSGSGLEADRARARELGAIEFVQKAVDFSAFKIELRNALTRHGFAA